MKAIYSEFSSRRKTRPPLPPPQQLSKLAVDCVSLHDVLTRNQHGDDVSALLSQMPFQSSSTIACIKNVVHE